MACRTCRSAFELLPRRASSSVSRSLAERPYASRTALAAAAQASRARVPQRRQLHRTAARCAAAEPAQPAVNKETSRVEQKERIDKQEEDGKMTSSLRKNFVESLAKTYHRAAPKAAAPYLIHGATQRIYDVCAQQADYTISEADRKAGTVQLAEEGEEIGTSAGGIWHRDFHLLPTFSTWSHVTMLHMYLVVTRLRCLDRDAYTRWQSALVDHFFHAAEYKMEDNHGMTSRAIRQRYLKDLFQQWRGVLLAYDEGLTKSVEGNGDAVLAAAVWRNLYKAREDVDIRHLAAIVAWMRRCLRELDEVDDADLAVYTAEVFKWPAKAELMIVDRPVKELEGTFRSREIGEGKEVKN